MKDIHDAAPSLFSGIRFVLTDMDETLTFQGRLGAETYGALARLQDAGIRVLPVTAAPAGWCDQMARMWPVDGVIGENGGLFYRRSGPSQLARSYWHDDETRMAIAAQLSEIAGRVLRSAPGAALAEDQPFRLTSIAFLKPEEKAAERTILQALRAEGLDVTVNNLWILGWIGGYEKLAMTRRVLAEFYELDISRHPEKVFYCGDSGNDAPMFGVFRHSAGVSTIRQHLSDIPVPPTWITRGPGGAGFVEVADTILKSRQ